MARIAASCTTTLRMSHFVPLQVPNDVYQFYRAWPTQLTGAIEEEKDFLLKKDYWGHIDGVQIVINDMELIDLSDEVFTALQQWEKKPPVIPDLLEKLQAFYQKRKQDFE